MGAKASNNFQSDRPESGGADKDDIREKNGLLDREKETFTKSEADQQSAAAQQQGKSGLQNGVESPQKTE